MRTSNNNSSRAKTAFLVMLLLVAAGNAAAQVPTATPPLVYSVENSGANFPQPVLRSYDQLPFIRPLPDPFTWADGSGRDTSFASWERRRNEIKAMIEKWDIGPKPNKSDLVINAVYTPGSNGGVLTVTVTRLSNGQSLTLNSKISLPTGTAPAQGWPAVIGMSLAPSGGPVNNSVAKVDFMHDEVTTYVLGQEVEHVSDPYFLMYPEYYTIACPGNGVPCQSPPPLGQTEVGQYAAWSWGVSRLIDGMEIAAHQAVNPLPIDLKHLGVNGCSYAGKMALFAGAFDERIAATFAQESGGGGLPAWRVSQAIEPQGAIEKADSTSGVWFRRSMKTEFARDKVYRFPYDHHELEAMVAPRALLVSGNTDFVWLSNRSAYVTARATQKVYETLGVGDRYGFYIDGGHGHCATLDAENSVINAFYNKFLLGQDIPYDVHVYPSRFADIDPDRWTQWWESGVPNDPRYNVALASAGSTALADTEYLGGGKSYPASAAIDGDTTGNAWRSGGGWSDGTPDAYPDILEVDFKGPQVIDEIHIYTLPNNYKKRVELTVTTLADLYGIEDFEVQTNTTTCAAGGPCTIGTDWVTVPGGSVTGNTLAWRQFKFSTAITATKMRVVVNKARSQYSRIVEVKALGFPAGFPTLP